MMAVDPRRYGPYTSKRYVVQKNEETYRNVFVIHYPDEERADARPAKTSPVYDKLEAHGRGVRAALRLGARQLVRAAGRSRQGRVELPPLELLRARGQRGPAICASTSASSI